MPLRTGISIALIAIGPCLLAAVTATALLLRRNKRSAETGQRWAARIIIAAALLATALVTAGALV